MDFHPFALKFPLLEGEEWEAFKADIKLKGGPRNRVIVRMVDGKQQGIDGRNRWEACRQLGLPCPVETVPMADEDVRAFIIRQNVLRRHMTPELRREIVAELRSEGQSTRQIAATVGAGESTVRRDLAGATNGAPGGNVTGKDGKKYKAKSKNPKPEPRIEGGDSESMAVPKKAKNALADTWHLECARLLSKITKEVKSAISWSVWLDGSVLDYLKGAEQCFLSAAPTQVCPDCDGHGAIDKDPCHTCRQGGYLASQA